MVHRPTCGCHHCQPPPKPPGCRPPQADGVLVQKIIACEKRHIPRLCAALEAAGLPAAACPPFQLTRIQPGGTQPWWTPLGEADGCGRTPVCVSIPVCLWICDSRGQTHAASAVVEVETWLPRTCCLPESWRHSLFILPCVQLAGSESCSHNACFQVQLNVSLEMYLLRFEPCLMRRSAPACPDLPLYPPPIPSPCC